MVASYVPALVVCIAWDWRWMFWAIVAIWAVRGLVSAWRVVRG